MRRCAGQDSAVGWLGFVGTELRDTADHLDRMAAATEPEACRIPCGVCAEHGNTLTSTDAKA